MTDIDATNPSLWNTWRASLLRQLYLEARRALRRGIENPLDKDEWISATQAEVQDILHDQGISSSKIDSVWNTLEDDYFLQDSTSEMAWQVSSIIEHGDSSEPLILIKDGASDHALKELSNRAQATATSLDQAVSALRYILDK